MSVQIEKLAPGALELKVSGKLEASDYEKINSETESGLQQMEKLSLLFRIEAFEGWSPRGLFEDAKFDLKHYTDVSRIALVAREQGKEWMATVAKPFTAAKVEFFPESELEQARKWVTATLQ